MPARRSDYTLLSQLGDIPYQSLDSSLPEQKKLLEKTPLISLEERLDRNFPRKAVVPFGHVEKSSFGVSGKVPLSYRDQSVSSGLDRGRDLVENHSDRISSAFHDRGHTSSYTEWNSCLPADRFSFSSVGERCSSVSLDRSPPVVAGEQYGNQSFDQSLFRAGLWSSLDRSYAGDGSIGGYGGTFPPGSSMLQRQSSGSSFTDSLLSTDVPLSTLSPTISLSASESTLFGAYYDDACKQDAAKGTKQSEGSSQSWAQQIVQSYNLQLALALRLVGEAELTEEPLLKFQAKESLLGTGSAARTSVEATALRFWVNGSLGYNDKIRDGFYHIWGMNPYVWAICNDSDEGGRMPSLDSLRAVNPAESSLEVILFDKHGDSHLRELENQAVGLVYKATDSIELAERLAKLVGDQMGGTAPLEHRELMAQWKAASRMLKDCLSCVVIPIGSLSVGLCRHRALLFKALADSVDLPCRVTRGCKYCGLDDGASCLVLCRNEREFLVDLVAQPGTLCNPESFLRSLPSLPVSSPLRLPDLMFSEITGDDGSLVKNSKSKGKVVDALGTAPGWQDPFESPLVAESVSREKNRSSWEKSGPMFSGKVPVSAKLASIWPALEHSVITTTEGERMVISRSPSTNMLKSLSGSNAIIDSERITSEGRRVASHITSTAVLDGVKAGEPMVPNDTSMLKKEPLQNNFASTAQGKVDTDFLPQQLTLQSQKQAGLDGSFHASLKGMDRTEERLLELTEEQGETRVKTQSLEQALALEGLEIPWEELTLRERIGAGSFGTVHRADWHGSDVAVKILIEQDLYDERLKEFMREVALMKRMRHPNVVLFMGAVTKRPNLSIVTEYLPRGSLFRLLHRTGVRESLDERRRIRMALDVARGMNYLHRLNPPIVHRDLKSPNLLVDKTWTVKVCDFGLSRFKANTFLSSRSAAGTPEWMAPEVLRDEPSNEKSDIYSFGVILWELVTLQQPWSGLSPAQVVGAVGFQHRRLQIPKDVHPDIAVVIESCFANDPRQRPSFLSIMESLKALQKSPVTQPVGSVAT